MQPLYFDVGNAFFDDNLAQALLECRLEIPLRSSLRGLLISAAEPLFHELSPEIPVLRLDYQIY